MELQYLLLKDVARILNLKVHQITYAICSGRVAEPALRVANKRVFCEEDVRRLASHFRVAPRWPSADPTCDEVEASCGLISPMLAPPYSVESTGETGHEVKDGDGVVFCWTAVRAKALIIAGLLESVVRA